MRISSIIKGPRRVRRMAQIARKGASHGLGYFIGRLQLQKHLPPWLRPPGIARAERPEDLAVRFANVLEELGPTFVKFGQMLSTRPDVLPIEYVHELKRICHHVAPFSAEVSRNIIAQELGRPVEELFNRFGDEPRASGSIAQVHEAELPDGTSVVVKVRRPRIERLIEDDLAILMFLAEQADRVEEFRAFRLPMLVEEFGQGIQGELDFVAEAAYTHKFGVAFSDVADVDIPQVFWDYTSQRVLTMRRMEGAHLSEVLEGKEAGLDRKALARTIMDAYLRQFFILGIFHADPHPGNILVSREGSVSLLDFGLVGRVSARLRRDLGICLMALGDKEFELVAEVIGDMGRLAPGDGAGRFHEEIVTYLERYSSVPLEKVDFQRSFYDMMSIIRKYKVEVPRDFVLMGRALVVITGLVTQLDPEVRVEQLAEPYGRKLLRQKLSAQGIRRKLTVTGYHVSNLLGEGPRSVRRMLRRLQEGMFEFTIRHVGFEKALRELDQTGNRLSLSIILAAVIVASSMLLNGGIGAVSIFGAQVSVPGVAGLLFGMVLGVWLIFGILGSGRL